MLKLTDRQLELLSPEARLLVTAEFINIGEGTLTEAGRGVMWLILTQKYQKEFLAVALRVIEEEEKKNK